MKPLSPVPPNLSAPRTNSPGAPESVRAADEFGGEGGVQPHGEATAPVLRPNSSAPLKNSPGAPGSVRAADKFGGPRRSVRAILAAALLAATLLAPAGAHATGFTDAGQDLGSHAGSAVRVEGSLRARGAFLHNADLDRGLTPSGLPLFAIPRDGGQTLSAGDARLRTDVSAFAPSGTLALRVRADVFDGGGLSERLPDAGAQRADALVIDRLYAEWLTPVGVLSAGRMGSTWGLGILANGGDCADCDRGDAADRVAFVTPLAGHLFAAALDVSAVDPYVPQTDRPDGFRAARETSTVSVAVMRWRNADSVERRRNAGKWTLDYGAVLSQRQDREGGAASFLATPVEGVPRGMTARVADGWLRFVGPRVRVEAEAAFSDAIVREPSIIPGVTVDEVRSRSFGAALETELGAPASRFAFGLDAGVASGDPAYGFSSDSAWYGPAARGDLRGSQALPPWDSNADDFRFHPDYRVDRILFREIVGTVTDAVYLRPHARVTLLSAANGTLVASVAAIGSRALHASSTPGGEAPLGVEVDPTLAWEGRDRGLSAALEHAVLFPLAGLDNPDEDLRAKAAHLVRLRLGWSF